MCIPGVFPSMYLKRKESPKLAKEGNGIKRKEVEDIELKPEERFTLPLEKVQIMLKRPLFTVL